MMGADLGTGGPRQLDDWAEFLEDDAGQTAAHVLQANACLNQQQDSSQPVMIGGSGSPGFASWVYQPLHSLIAMHEYGVELDVEPSYRHTTNQARPELGRRIATGEANEQDRQTAILLELQLDGPEAASPSVRMGGGEDAYQTSAFRSLQDMATIHAYRDDDL